MRKLLIIVVLFLVIPTAGAHFHGRGLATPPPPGNQLTLDNGNQLTDDAGNTLRLDP